MYTFDLRILYPTNNYRYKNSINKTYSISFSNFSLLLVHYLYIDLSLYFLYITILFTFSNIKCGNNKVID